MAEKLGIFVSSDKHLDHLLGIAKAARTAGKVVTVFLTNRGVLLTKHPEFAKLEGFAEVALCASNFQSFDLEKPIPVVADECFGTQARHGMMIDECDRYMVL